MLLVKLLLRVTWKFQMRGNDEETNCYCNCFTCPDTRTQRYGYNTNSNDGRVINRSTSGAFLTYFDNYRVYNFVSETKNSDGTVTRLWQPKKDVAVITDYNSFSYANDGAKVYNFDEFGNQLPEESTDFKSLDFLGEFSINSWTAYRFWK